MHGYLATAAGHWLFKKKMDEFIIEFPVRMIAHGKIRPGFFGYDAFGVGKGEKTGFSVVGTHATLAEAAEAHLAGGQMDDGIVDAATAKNAMGSHKPGSLFVTGEKIKRQRMSHGIDLCDGVFQ